ncbi:MAG: hypothetical protein KDD50_02640 [Bdellovibrionales bacterium]|nr:hypothetical protein [Bdellovibrionales bacterium]
MIEFESSYWYAAELKKFAKEIGVASNSKLRKDELEIMIKSFLKNGKIKDIKPKPTSKTKVKDVQIGLSMGLPIVNYISNKETKDFILSDALKIDPNLPEKSGCKYWLNRWREEQISIGTKITYGDLVRQFVKLRNTKGKFPQIPSTKFNNFVSDYLSAKEGTRKQAIKEWEKLKRLDITKTYLSWKKYHSKKRDGSSGYKL